MNLRCIHYLGFSVTLIWASIAAASTSSLPDIGNKASILLQGGTAKLLTHDADRTAVQNDALVLFKAGFASIHATLEFNPPEAVKPARYEVWTKFSLGGTASEQFSLIAGTDKDHLTPRGQFNQSTNKSWESAWRKSGATVTLLSDDQVIRIVLDGKATQQLNLEAFLLVAVDSVPADLTNNEYRLRSRLLDRPAPMDATRRLFLVEGDSAEPLDGLLRTLASEEVIQKLASTTVELRLGKTGQEFAAQAGVKPPVAILTDKEFKVLAILDPSTSVAKTSELLASGNEPTSTASTAIDAPINSSPVLKGRIEGWATVGTWAGPAGMSLSGLGAESEVRPGVEDPCVVTRFDAGKTAHWQLSNSEEKDGVVTIDPSSPDLTWPRGSAYAHVYLHSEQSIQVKLRLAHTGVDAVAWFDGSRATLETDNRPFPEAANLPITVPAANAGTTDQGNRFDVHTERRAAPQCVNLNFTPGWHHLLLKFIVQTKKGEPIAFVAQLSGGQNKVPDGISTAISDPESAAALHDTARKLTPLFYTDSPFNLVRAGEDVRGRIVARWVQRKNDTTEPGPIVPFHAILHTTINDFNGIEVKSLDLTGDFPGDVSFDLGQTLPPGYYSAHLSLRTVDGKFIMAYPPDGFSVILGTAAQADRKAQKKVATTYYFMAGRDLYKTLYFPYMLRMGIFRNVGGNNDSAVDLYHTSTDQGIALACDLWNHRDPAYLRRYIQETAPYVDSYKSYNEIDISPAQKGTPESWVAKEKQEYELIRELDPTAVYVGGSLVRVGNDPWFEECLRLGIDRYQDAWDVHAYPQLMPTLGSTISNSPNESEAGLLAVYKRLGKQNDKPFWLGETGARASHGEDGRRWQAESIAKLVAWVNSRPDFHVIGFLVPWWYSRSAALADISDIELGHMPGEAALYTANALIDGFAYQHLDLGDDVQAAYFGKTLMVWTTKSQHQITAELQGAGPWVLVDVVGQARSLNVVDGKINLDVSRSPQYVLPRDEYERLTSDSKSRSEAPK